MTDPRSRNSRQQTGIRLVSGTVATGKKARSEADPARKSGRSRKPIPIPRETESPEEYWYQYFRRHRPEPRDVIRTVEKLHKDGRHHHVVALIMGALANEQTQSWMYDVLALSMKLDGRADHEIERVLLSRVDFTTTDVPSLLYSAAFLNRLEGKRPALRLYRQASEINPRRPEPYVLGLKLARELGDIDAIQWACTGILRHAWTEDYRSRHQKAEDAAKDLQKDLLRAGKRERAAGFRDAMAQARRRDVMIRVEWSGDGDLDLSVSEPLDTTCSILQPRTASGGVLLHDGYGPSPENCYEEYVCVKAPSGRYELTVNYLDGKIVGKRCQVTMTLHQGTPGEKVFRQSVRLEGPSATVSFDLQNGRREQPLAKPQPLVKPTGALRRIPRQQMLARVRRIGRRQEGDIPVAGPAAQAGIKHRGNVAQGAGVAQAAGMAQPGGIVRAAGGPAQPAAPNPGFRLPAGSFTAGVGFQPVIGFVGEGVSLTASAVVSADRRFVRISVAPFFNTLREIQTFSFQGTQ